MVELRYKGSDETEIVRLAGYISSISHLALPSHKNSMKSYFLQSPRLTVPR